jgi:hypothetical protein
MADLYNPETNTAILLLKPHFTNYDKKTYNSKFECTLNAFNKLPSKPKIIIVDISSVKRKGSNYLKESKDLHLTF